MERLSRSGWSSVGYVCRRPCLLPAGANFLRRLDQVILGTVLGAVIGT